MLNGLYFPALRPAPAFSSALTDLVDRLFCYTKVEDCEPVPGCEVRAVAPLGPDRERFLSLLKEMTGREAEYFKGQLAAAFGAGRDRDEASGWNLAAALKRDNSVKEPPPGKKSGYERLWQARLVLELAERVSAAEMEIQR